MNCMNHKDEGEFVGQLCYPCYRFVAYGEGTHSQAFRNSAEIVAKCLSESMKISIYQALVTRSTFTELIKE